MTDIDFLEPSTAGKLVRGIKEHLRRHLVNRITAAMLALIVFTAALEGWRVVTSFQLAAEAESRRDALQLRAAASESRIRKAKAGQDNLDEMRALRDKSSAYGLALLRVGNAVGANVGLTVLRRVPKGIEMEGHATSFASIRNLVEHMSAARAGTIASFETRREDDEKPLVWFRVGLQRDSDD